MRVLLAIVLVSSMACPSSPPPPPPPQPNAGPCEGPPPSPEHVCVQDCGPPVVREGDPPPPWHWLSPAEVESRNQNGCPRCLPPGARIATPDGEVAISELAVGDAVVSLDEAGRRIVARVVVVSSTPARVGHTLVRVTLADGRVVAASPEHPIADGRLLQTLRVGEVLDGASITAVERVALAGDRTWDLVTSGPTGLYIADGVVLRSTLVTPRNSR